MCMQSVVCLDQGRSAEIIPFRNGLTGQLVGTCTRRVPGSSGTNSFMPSITTRTRNKPISGQ